MSQLCGEDNFKRAWRWIRSNPDANYKGYFRQLYSMYAIADNNLINDLRDRVKRGSYEPKHATKLFLPKPSGILRPFSLLDIEDQIVYQASANIIAEQLYRKVRRRYYNEVFGHLYAGKSNIWFYRKWSKGYASFNKVARDAFDDGNVYTANFDLTACYDSIDHGVLKHFLLDIKCEREFVDNFISWLSVWTATERGVYHNHGIPQGPLSSGIISEVVLRHFDEKRIKTKSIKYIRYVDDIKLFAKNEVELRRSLVALDLLSKDVGLFPQSSKISLHKIKNIEDELKTISNPIETIFTKKIINKNKLYKRIVDLTPKYSIQDPTRFKYLLANAEPNSTLTNRLWIIYEKHPEIFQSFTRYLKKYKHFPLKVEKRILEEIRNHKLYDSIVAAFIDASNGRITGKSGIDAIKVIKSRWKPKANLPDLQASAAKWLIRHDSFSFSSCETAAYRSKSWWAKASITFELSDDVIGKPSLEKIANVQLRGKCQNTSLAAAYIINKYDLNINKPYKGINPVGGKVLRELGLIRRAPGSPCYIAESMNRMSGVKTALNWKLLFGTGYRNAERQIIQCRSYSETDINGWVNAMDVFIDRLLEAIYAKDGTIGTYTLGRIGSIIGSASSRFAVNYPDTYKLAKEIHDTRASSDLSHPVVRSSGKATGRIKFGYMKTVKPLIRKSVTEIKIKFGL